MTVRLLTRLTVCSLLVLPTACQKEAPASVDPTLGLPELKQPEGFTAAKAELGKQLFFDPRLSASGKMACTTCHEPERAWTDGKALSPKDDGSVNVRNSPSLYDVGRQPHFYWDGRAATLEKNVEAAWKANMSGKPDEAAAALAKVDGYRKAFEAAFGGAPTGANITEALAHFIRTQVGGGSRYDRFAAGDKTALNAEEKAGHDLFLGKAGCVACHTPPLFTNHLFHNVGVGMSAEKPDPGRQKVDEKAALGSFKTPSLRSVSKTGPYFHDGSVATLEDAVKTMAKGGIDNPHLDPILKSFAARTLTDAELKQLVAFLGALDTSASFVKPVLPN